MSFVPNSPPTVAPGARRLAVIGESPGLEEENWAVCPSGHEYSRKKWDMGTMRDVLQCPVCGSSSFKAKPTPFVGASGYLLNDCLRRAGIRREQCFLGNVSRVRLSETQFSEYGRIAPHLADLSDELAVFQPNCVLLLGNQPLRAFHPWHWQTVAQYEKEKEDARQLWMFNDREMSYRPKAKPSGTKFTCKVSEWRGSIFQSTEIAPGGPTWKCVSAYHPAAVLRQRDWMPILRQDIKRAVADSEFTDLRLPTRRTIVPATADELIALLTKLEDSRGPLAFDIEGYAKTGITICSFAASADEAVVVPLRHLDLTPWWSPADEHRVVAAFRLLLEDPAVPKIMHNALYELFVLRWSHGIKIAGIGGDTMFKWHELYAELDKALEVPASVLTRQPYWKYGRDAQTDEEMIAYNAIDSCVTFELDALMEPLLSPGQRKHYEFNLSLLEPMSEQMFHGIRFDLGARSLLTTQIRSDVLSLQGRLDRLAGVKRPTLEQAAEEVCYARKIGLVQKWEDVAVCAKPTWQEKV